MDNDTLQRRRIENNRILVIEERRDLDLFAVSQTKPSWLESFKDGFHLLLDLSKVNYVEAYSIRAIVECARVAEESDRHMVVVTSHQIDRVIDILPERYKLYLPPLYNSVDIALRALD